MKQLLGSSRLAAACPQPFNEGMLWLDRAEPERVRLERLLQVAFHNITKLMDCVGCEKCKMHAKLQILGIATSLKILFSQPHVGHGAAGSSVAADAHRPSLQLHRNEVIALINMLAKVAESVEAVRQLSVLAAAEQ